MMPFEDASTTYGLGTELTSRRNKREITKGTITITTTMPRSPTLWFHL